MNEKPIPLTLSKDSEPYLIRAKEISGEEVAKLDAEVDKENEEREKSGEALYAHDQTIVVDTIRRKMYKLAPMPGEFLRSKEANEEFNTLLRVQLDENKNPKFLNTVNDPTPISVADDEESSSENSNK